MRRGLTALTALIAVLLLLLRPVLQAQTASCSGSNISAASIDTSTASSSKTVVIPTDVPSGATVYFGIMNRTDESTTLSSVSDPVNGTWGGTTVGPIDSSGGTFRTWFRILVNSAALTGSSNRTLTATTSAGVSTQLIAGWCSDSNGAQTFDTSGAIHNDALNEVTHTTSTLTTAGAGMVIAVITSNNAFTSNYSNLGPGDVMVSGAPAAGQRIAIIYEQRTGSGTPGFVADSTPTLSSVWLAASFLSPSAPSSTPGGLLRLGVGN